MYAHTHVDMHTGRLIVLTTLTIQEREGIQTPKPATHSWHPWVAAPSALAPPDSPWPVV